MIQVPWWDKSAPTLIVEHQAKLLDLEKIIIVKFLVQGAKDMHHYQGSCKKHPQGCPSFFRGGEIWTICSIFMGHSGL